MRMFFSRTVGMSSSIGCTTRLLTTRAYFVRGIVKNSDDFHIVFLVRIVIAESMSQISRTDKADVNRLVQFEDLPDLFNQKRHVITDSLFCRIHQSSSGLCGSVQDSYPIFARVLAMKRSGYFSGSIHSESGDRSAIF